MKGDFDLMTSEYFQISKIVATLVTMNTTLTVNSTERPSGYWKHASCNQTDRYPAPSSGILQATQCQLVFSRDLILDTSFTADWSDIVARKVLQGR
jgi:hypothetical protein